MEEVIAIQNLRTTIGARLSRQTPVFKTYNLNETKYYGCRLENSGADGSSLFYGVGETEEKAFLKAKYKLIASLYHGHYPLNKECLYGCMAFSQQSIAYDRALRSYLAQSVLTQSMNGAGIPLQIPLKETNFHWEIENKYTFLNYCLAVSEGPIHMSLVLALAIPKAAAQAPVLAGVGYNHSVDESAQIAWAQLIEKEICEKMFGEHHSEFRVLEQVEKMGAEGLKKWLMTPKGNAVPRQAIVINMEQISKEILFADSELSVVRVSESF